MEYFEKIDEATQTDLKWNLPEQKQGRVNIIGGSLQNFRTEVRITEFLSDKYPIRDAELILPDALKDNLPELPNFRFLLSTESGSFAESQALIDVLNEADFNLILGDLSKNAITGKALMQALKGAERMTLVTRDAVDLIIENNPERVLMNEQLILMASLPQLQKLLRGIYYPKMITMSQTLVQIADIMHKFTLSYPIKIITLHNGQFLIVENGLVKAVPLGKSGYSPIMVWSGELAAKIVAMNLYNPNNFANASLCAIFD